MSSRIIEAPVIREEFFDREKELDILLDAISKHEHIVVVGRRKVGKTSILFKLGEILLQRGYVFVYIYVPESPSVEIVANEMLLSMLRGLAGASSILLFEDALGRSIEKYPECASTLLKLKSLPRNEAVFRDAIILFDDILENIRRKGVVVFDEFQNIASSSMGFLDYLRQAMWKAKNLSIILCGSMIRMIDKILSSASAPLGLRKIKIEPFDFKTVKDFIVRNVRKSVSETIVAFLYALTGGMPFHIKIISNRLNMMGVEKISWWIVKKILLDELLSDSGALYNYYSGIETRLGTLSSIYLEILYAIASGKRKLSEIAKHLNKGLPEINYYVRRLRGMEIIDENNVILDEMFELWMSTVWPLLRKTPILELEKRRKIFYESIEKIIQQYKDIAGRAVEIIVYELIRRMKGEKIDDEKMPNPKQVMRNVVVDGQEVDILATGNKDAWIIEVKTSPVTRKDVINLEEKSRLFKEFKRKHKIIVALHTISYDALQEAARLKVSIWTKHKLKKLLKYYKMPIPPMLF